MFRIERPAGKNEVLSPQSFWPAQPALDLIKVEESGARKPSVLAKISVLA